MVERAKADIWIEWAKILLNRQRCELMSGVTFSDEAFADLEELARYCVRYADPGAEGRQAPLFMSPDFRPATTEFRLEVLHELVMQVQILWRQSSGVRSGTWYNKSIPSKNGPLGGRRLRRRGSSRPVHVIVRT